MYTFNPPTVKEGPAGFGPLFYRIGLLRGISVLKIDGEYYEVRSPSQDEIAEAEIFYQGGRTYQVTESEANELIAAGYEVVTS
jgi:hypothetical protein